MEYLLSICIPTYNHATELKSVLKRIVGLPAFQNNPDVEVVISDNASTDDTQKVCESFVRLNPDRIRYFRNQKNVFDRNFECVLSRGRGKFLKLLNDSLLLSDAGLLRIISCVKDNLLNKPVLFFPDLDRKDKEQTVRSLREFIEAMSFRCTWIGSFGIWQEDLRSLSDFSRYADTHLPQVDVLCRILIIKGLCKIFWFCFAESLPRPGKGGYSLAKTFGVSYPFLLNLHVESGELARGDVAKERINVLRHLVIPYYSSCDNAFKRFDYWRDLLCVHWWRWRYWTGMPKIILAGIVSSRERIFGILYKIESVFRIIVAPHLVSRILWRRRNRHNYTCIKTKFDQSMVCVGRGTYGDLHVISGSKVGRLLIGNYVSIAPDVRFFLAGGHPYRTLTNYPFAAFNGGVGETDLVKGPIIVHDDVWIGAGAIILSGVEIGQGAIIGAGAVVVRDVPPYAIVGGVPANIVKYRFDESVRKKLHRLDWAQVDLGRYTEFKAHLEKTISAENVDQIIDNVLKGR